MPPPVRVACEYGLEVTEIDSPFAMLPLSRIGISCTRPMVDSVWQELQLETSAWQALAGARDEQTQIIVRSPVDD